LAYQIIFFLPMVWAAMKAHHGALKVAHAFQAAARPLCTGGARHPQLRSEPTVVGISDSTEEEHPFLEKLAEGPYFVIALMLDAATLCKTDTTCRMLYAMNRANIGPWRALGVQTFDGLELEQEGLFEQPTDEQPADERERDRKMARYDWKERFRRYCAEVPTFCAPFQGPQITSVAHPDEVAYFRCRLCTDILDEGCLHGVYLEVEVLLNPDNLSMAVVDFEAGGCSSVTFSPDTGAVIRERKVREAPRKVEGAYIQPLSTLPPGRRFHGIMGLYLFSGSLAFFRRCSTGTSDGGVMDLGQWETTGFVSDLSWAEGRRLTPSLAFRGEGEYSVKILRVDKQPPLTVGRPSAELHSSVGWSGFDWEVGDHDDA
jgi:hypothetical protein